MPPPDQAERLRAAFTLEGNEGDRWKVRVDITPVCDEIHVCGVTLGLVNADGDSMGPAVVLPLGPILRGATTVRASVKGPTRLLGHMALRLIAYASDAKESIQIDHRITPCRGFRAFLCGASPVEGGPPPESRSLSEREEQLLAVHFPWAFPEKPLKNDAFDAFQDDFRDTFDLEETDGVTEEILRMLKEP